MKKILILNGPNLNLLGTREPEIYGHTTLADINHNCEEHGKSLGMTVACKQSNHEGELVTWIQEAINNVDAIIINAAAYTHTSVAILDALKMHQCPIIEVHLSDPKTREEFRHHSFIEYVATHTISGQGALGYTEALTFIANSIKQ
ncbi:MAG: type II 3-dehydroquinate dehydratase [Alphaproteobacteria bacterium]|nr:type II 3-dehydroquinate dehydratase [Alphaproteobacteria bacterium]